MVEARRSETASGVESSGCILLGENNIEIVNIVVDEIWMSVEPSAEQGEVQ
jgi:hypothetical protein